jgi:hypothetical protein
MSEHIDGLPPGVKVSSLTFTRNGEEMRGEFVRGATVTLEPDNAYGALDLASVPIPAGYERDGDKPEGWFRDPLPDELTLCNLNGDGRCLYASAVHRLHESDATDDRRRIILRKVKPRGGAGSLLAAWQLRMEKLCDELVSAGASLRNGGWDVDCGKYHVKITQVQASPACSACAAEDAIDGRYGYRNHTCGKADGDTPARGKKKRVLVIELPILEGAGALAGNPCVPRALDLGTVTCISATTAEYLVEGWRAPEPRYRIEEREA